MNDWVVESPSFEEQLMNNRIVYLNQKGINEVVELIKNKDKEIEKLNKQIEEYQKALDETTMDLEREKSQVKEYGTRLIKAIEYVEENKRTHESDEYCFDDMIDDVIPLLNILKGVDKE